MTAAGQGAPVALVCNSAWYAWNFRANTIRALRMKGHSVAVIAPPDETVSKILAIQGVTYLPWQLSIDGHNPLHEAASFIALIRILRRIRPAFVFSFTIKPNIYTGLACRIFGISYAPNVTGLGMVITSSGFAARLLSKLYAFACTASDRLFVQNPHDLQLLRNSGLPLSVPAVALKGSGVDLSHFASHPMPSERTRAFVFIGRLQEDKGVRDFIEAARRLHAEGIPARFTVLGGTEHTNASAITAADLDTWRSEGLVDFVDAQEDVRPWLRQAHVLVLPSHGGEGIPRVLLEAASIGRPTIVSDVPGCRDVVVDGETGLICQTRNAVALAEAIRAVVELSSERLEEMGRNARRLAEASFSETCIINEYLDCIQHRQAD